MTSNSRFGIDRWVEQWSGRWASYLERGVPLKEARNDRIASALPSLSFFSLMLASTIIATLGLVSSSAAVVIGAMIVAPLMNPVLSASFGMTIGDYRLMWRSLVTLSLGTLLAVGASYVITVLIPVNIVGPEVLARTSPNIIDLVVAIAAGFSGALAITRPRIASSIAGVAVAVALVPPLCVTGIGLAVGPEVGVTIGPTSFDEVGLGIALGSFLLFLANLVGIVISSSGVFLVQGYGSLRRAWLPLACWLLFALLLVGPLTGALQEFYLEKRIDVTLDRLAAEEPERHRQSRVRYLDVEIEGSKTIIEIVVEAPLDDINEESFRQLQQRLLHSLRDHDIKELESRIRVVPIDLYELDAQSP